MTFEKRGYVVIIKRVLSYTRFFFLFLVLVMSCTACDNNTMKDLPEIGFNSMVEIYDTQVLRMQPLTIALGQYIGNNQVITVIDYDDINSGKFRLDALGISGQQENIEVLTSDPQTGTTIFRLTGIEKEEGAIRLTSTLKEGENVVVLGWCGPSGIAKKVPGIVNNSILDKEIIFTIRISHNDLQTVEWVPTSGATVTDMEGNILGLVKIKGKGLTYTEIQEDLIVEIVSIDRFQAMQSLRSY